MGAPTGGNECRAVGFGEDFRAVDCFPECESGAWARHHRKPLGGQRGAHPDRLDLDGAVRARVAVQVGEFGAEPRFQILAGGGVDIEGGLLAG